VREEGEPVADRTMILYGSNLGNANTHVTTNMPTVFAGGGFKHGQHIASIAAQYPLPNLFVSMLQRMGLGPIALRLLRHYEGLETFESVPGQARLLPGCLRIIS